MYFFRTFKKSTAQYKVHNMGLRYIKKQICTNVQEDNSLFHIGGLESNRSQPESIEWFIEDQAFSTSYDLAKKIQPLAAPLYTVSFSS